jgi:Leucine-rich repeat (LRR) protein
VELPYPEELQAMLGGGYVVEGFLGQGGMGAVYKGLQMPLKRPVAIKILARGVGMDYGFEERFKREAYAMAALTHPHIVQVYDCGDAGENFLFISMEMVEGGDLSDALKNKQVTPELALKLMPQICDGLQAAHERGIIHRDIKPANIFLTKDGRAKVADFGLAKKLDTTGTMVTKTGLGLGTPDYAAPEQYDNLPDIDHRADIYSLGVMMYQLLTGSIPRGSWKAPSTRAAVDPRLDDVVLKALASDRDDRYQTVAEMKAGIVSVTMATLTTGTIPMARAASAASSAAIASGKSGAMPAYTGPVPVPTRTSPMPARPAAPSPSTRTSAVPTARSTGPVAQPRQTAPVPARSQGTPAARAATSPVRVPVKKAGSHTGLIAALVCVVLGVGAWFVLKSGGGGGGGGRVVHLLDLNNPQGDAVRGLWTASPAGLSGKTPPPQPGLKDDDRMPVFELNYTPPEEYDFEIEFSRNGGTVVQILSSGGASFTHEYQDNGSNNSRAGFSQIDNKNINGPNEGNVKITPIPRDGSHHVSVVEVRRHSVRSFLDGKQVLQWSGDFSRLSVPTGFRLSSDNGHLGLGGWNGDLTFYRADVREISGAGQLTAPQTLAGTAGGSKMSPSDVKPLVEWLVPLKGYLIVQVGTINRKVTSLEELPASFDRVVEVDVPGGSRPDNFRVPAGVLGMLKSYKEMKRIALRQCQLRTPDIAPVLMDKPLLTNLGLGGNHVDDTIVDSLLRLPMLESVDLSYNKEFTGRGLEKLSVLRKIYNMVVNDSSLSDEGLAGLGKLSGIKGLSLNNTKITDAGLGALPPMASLEIVAVRSTRVSVRGLQALRTSPKLRRIELGVGREIKDIGELVALKDLPNLQELAIDFGGPKERENIGQMARLGELAPFTALKRLETWGTYGFQGPPPGGLEQLPNLEFLQINSKFTDDDIALLKPLKQLHYLRLNGATLTESGALKLTPLASLREISRKAFTEAGLKAFKQYRPDVRIVE